MGVISPILKIKNSYVPKSTMGSVDPLKGQSSDLMMWSDNFRFNPNYVNKYLTKIILHLPLMDLFTWYFHFMKVLALSSGKVKSTSTLILVWILPAYVCHCITASFLGNIFLDSLTIAMDLGDD